MEGGRVSHSWCMCVVVMAMVGWMGVMVGWMGAGMENEGQSQGGGRMSKDARVHFECEVMIPDHTTFQVSSSG